MARGDTAGGDLIAQHRPWELYVKEVEVAVACKWVAIPLSQVYEGPMKLLDLTLPTPAENVALDEALLEVAEAGQLSDEVLRLWEPAEPVVVLGRSSRAALEVDLAACKADGIPVLRRTSGGTAIVTGPGCLMYAVILRYAGREHLRLLDETHRHVLGIVVSALGTVRSGIEHCGTSDLAIAGRKFSGNSVRCKRDHLLYHGTLLYAFDLRLIDRLLSMPLRQPAYRADRPHRSFLMNLAIDVADIRRAMITAFVAQQTLHTWPSDLMQRLVAERYSKDAWNFER